MGDTFDDLAGLNYNILGLCESQLFSKHSLNACHNSNLICVRNLKVLKMEKLSNVEVTCHPICPPPNFDQSVVDYFKALL